MNFVIGNNFPDLLHELRKLVWENPQKYYPELKAAILDVDFSVLDSFIRGKYDVTIEHGQLFFVETGVDRTEEIVGGLERRYVEAGENCNLYFEGLKWQQSSFVSLEEYEDHIELYKGYYDKATEKFKQFERALKFFYRNWDLKRELPLIRTIDIIKRDTRLAELQLTHPKAVDWHALILTEDGRIWWWGVNVEYEILQHQQLVDELRSLGVDTYNRIEYCPNYGWRGGLYKASEAQINALIDYAIERGEDFIKGYERKIPLDRFIQFSNKQIQWHEL